MLHLLVESAFCLKQTPSLKVSLEDVEWLDDVWRNGVVKAIR